MTYKLHACFEDTNGNENCNFEIGKEEIETDVRTLSTLKPDDEDTRKKNRSPLTEFYEQNKTFIFVGGGVLILLLLFFVMRPQENKIYNTGPPITPLVS